MELNFVIRLRHGYLLHLSFMTIYWHKSTWNILVSTYSEWAGLKSLRKSGKFVEKSVASDSSQCSWLQKSWSEIGLLVVSYNHYQLHVSAVWSPRNWHLFWKLWMCWDHVRTMGHCCTRWIISSAVSCTE